MDKLSYALGQNIGLQMSEMGLKESLVIDDFAAGIADTLHDQLPQIDHAEAQQIIQQYFANLDQRRKAEVAERAKTARADGERFLASNAKRSEVKVTHSGLQYEVIAEGSGRHPKATDTVRCHYEGTLIDGTVFDSSYRRGAPAEFGLQQVIAGWTEGVQLMAEGSKYRFYIPYQLAYGEHGAGLDIPPYAALIFSIELIKVL